MSKLPNFQYIEKIFLVGNFRNFLVRIRIRIQKDNVDGKIFENKF